LQDNVKVFPSLSEESVKVINLRGGARVAVQQEAALDADSLRRSRTILLVTVSGTKSPRPCIS
jgi:hypothetical protein